MPDPPAILDQLTPIRSDSPKAHDASAISQAERHRQTRRANSGTPDLRNGHVALREAARTLRTHGAYHTAELSVQEQVALASALAAKFGEMAHGPDDAELEALAAQGDRAAELRLSERKQAATAWGIAQDKLILLQGRPPRPQEAAESDDKRAGLRELSRLLAGMPATPSEQLPASADAK